MNSGNSRDGDLELEHVAVRVARAAGLGDVERTGGGLEFEVFRAFSPPGAPWALRVPRNKIYRTLGEVPVPAASLQQKEYAIYRTLGPAGLPVPRDPRLILDRPAGLSVLVSRFVAFDDEMAESAEVGRFLARTHGLRVTDLNPAIREGVTAAIAVGARLQRRWSAIGALTDNLPDPPSWPLVGILLRELGAGMRSLLHLDIRSCNLLAASRALEAVVDWSSAMVMHPAMEFARMREYAQLAENRLDLSGIATEYRRHLPIPAVDAGAEAVLRLDAATMLAIVFLASAPDSARATWAVERIRELVDHIAKVTL